MPNIRNLIILTLLSLFMLALGVLGYMVLEDWGFLDALVMTIISVISVGFSEVRHLSPEGRLFTLILIFIGVGLVPYVTGSVVPFMVEGQIRRRH
ncbi:MAG: potassium channel family protein, partial [Desulfosudaceae bacterium]